MSASRLVLVGAAIVGVCSLFSLSADAYSSDGILIPAAIVAALGVTWGRFRSWVGSTALVLIASGIVVVLTLIDLTAVIFDLEDLAPYGGPVGLLARAACAGGGVIMLVGAFRSSDVTPTSQGGSDIDRTRRMAAVGGLMVAGSWVLMVPSGWGMTVYQALGVTAASIVVGLVWLQVRGRASLPLSTLGEHTLFLSLATIAVGMSLASLINTVGQWNSVVDVVGLWAFLPYVVYLGGAGILGMVGVTEAKAIKAAAGQVRFEHLAGAGLVGVVTLVVALVAIAVDRDDGQVEAVGEPTTTVAGATAQTGEGDAVSLGPEVPPIEACALLTEEEVEQALGLSHDAVEGFFAFGGGEGCSWQPVIDGESGEDLSVGVAPGDPNDFQEGAERVGVVGRPVADVGAAAVWFGGQGRGVLSVIDVTDIGYALIEVGVASTAIDDPTRLENAKVLVSRAVARLLGEGPQPVEAALCELITDEDAEEILAPLREGRPAARDEITTIGPSAPVDLTEPGDSSCKKLILAEIYVEAGSGNPADFEPGATYEGVAGEPIKGVGDAATWFAGVVVQDGFSAPHEAGLLAVRQDGFQFRIGLSLADVQMSDQLDTAKRLASGALIRIVAGDADVITVDHTAPNTSAESLVGNLVAKEESGAWSRGEGLVATLQLVGGEVESEEVLIRSDLEFFEATGIVNLAYQYIEENPDTEISAELKRLLGMIFFSDDQLEEMAGAGPSTVALPGFWSMAPTADVTVNCQTFFSGWQIPSGVDKCLQKRSSPDLDGYKVFGPAPPMPMAGWRDHHFDLALEALKETVPRYKSLGQLPPVNIVMSAGDDPEASAVASPRLPSHRDRPCGVTLFTNMQPLSDLDFKQIVAHELAHCLHGDTFAKVYTPVSDWWDEGLAEYLSNTVEEYSKNNLEIRDNLDKFDRVELGTAVLGRSYDNFIFFQQLFHAYGNDGIFALISSLPPGGGTRGTQEAALARFSGMTLAYHEFVEKVTDVEIGDTGGGVIGNAPDSEAITLTGPIVILDEPLPFGATRLALAVPNGLYACIEHETSPNVRLSWRAGRPAVPSGGWSTGLPDVLSGEAVVVATTTRSNGELTIDVKDVSDDPNCEDEEETTDPCLDFCGISDYFRYPEGIPTWVANMLPPLSDPIDISPDA